MEENTNEQQLVELLYQLTQIQSQIAAIISTRFERQTLDNLNGKIDDRKNSISSEAQRYGQNPNLAENAITEFSNALEQIRKEYSAEKNLWLAQLMEFQNKEIQHTLEIVKLKKEVQSQKETQSQQKPKQKKDNPEIVKNNGIEVVDGHHPLLDRQKVMDNLSSASLEDVSTQLDYYNSEPVLINGTLYHPFNDPVSAARLNARYYELTGEIHPTFAVEAPKVIDSLLEKAPQYIEDGVYPPSYFETIVKIKNNIEKEYGKDTNITNQKQESLNVRNSSQEAIENVDDCQKRCLETIEDIAEDKDLAKTDNKQNIFSKLFAKIKDRIGGKEKFNKNVIEPLISKANYIREEVLPNIKDKIEQNVMPKLKSLLEKGKEKINEINLKEKFDKLMSIAKNGARNIIDKSSGLKEIAISTFSKGLSLAKEGLSQVVEKASDIISSITER